MKLTDSVTSVLRNFADINKNMVVQEGNTLATISESKTILGLATLDEEFPQEFGIYDALDFLNSVGLIEEPTLNFEEKFVTIQGAGNKLKYFFADAELLTSTPPEGSLDKMSKVFSEGDLVVKLSESQYLQLKRAAATLKASRLTIQNTEGSIVATVSDPGNSTANSYSLTLKDYEGADFNHSIDMNNIKILRGDYEVTISDKGLSRFQNMDRSVLYYVPLDKSKE